MKYRDYEAKVMLRGRLPEYGTAATMYVSAGSRTAAQEAARHKFLAFTRLPPAVIRSIKVTPVC